MARLVLLLAFVGAAFCQEFFQLDGKTADPCNKYLDVEGNRDCPHHSQVPAPQVTVLLPSIGSSGPLGAGGVSGTPLTITGKGFPRTRSAGAPPVVRTAVNFLALATKGDSCSSIETTSVVANDMLVSATVDANNNRQMRFNVPRTWLTTAMQLEGRPRLLCWSPFSPSNVNRFRYTGFKIGVVWSCNPSDDPANLQTCGGAAHIAAANTWTALTPLQRQDQLTRRTCCRGSIGNTVVNRAVGQCINANVQACCGGAAIEIAQEKCCNTTREIVAQVDGNCPCTATADCPIGESCCTASKYTELTRTDITTGTSPWWGAQPLWPNFRGECYNPARARCCDTGSIYDPGSHQCCVVNGIQSINKPCPCSADTDCVGSQMPTASRTFNHTCCRQTAPTPFESLTHEADQAGQTDAMMCSRYSNYPTGQGAAEVQRCLGRCIDPNYQICCNGAACMKEYEKCCNATCCNRWSATCFNSLRSGAPGNRYNSWNAGSLLSNSWYQGVVYEVCSSVEAIRTHQAIFIFVLPAGMLLAAHVGLALVMVFASKATTRKFSKLEISMMVLAVITSYLAMPLLFSPSWKYAVWVILAQILVFLTAAARIRWLNILCVIVQLITLIYVFDPFHGNALLTTSLDRFANGSDNVQTSGLLQSIARLPGTQYTDCSTFYGYFQYDMQMRDLDRFDNPEITHFGYCSRGWITALLFFAGLAIIGVLLQLFLSALGMFFRFHHNKAEDIVEFADN